MRTLSQVCLWFGGFILGLSVGFALWGPESATPVPAAHQEGRLFFNPDVIPKIVFDKFGRPCTPAGALITHSPLMVIPPCDP